MALHTPDHNTHPQEQPPALGGQPQAAPAPQLGIAQAPQGQPGGLLDLLRTPQGIETLAARMAELGVAPPGLAGGLPPGIGQAPGLGNFGALTAPQVGGTQVPLIPSPANVLPPGVPTIPNATGFGGVAPQGQQPDFSSLIGGGVRF